MAPTPDRRPDDADEYAVRGYLVRLSGHAWGVTIGVLAGLAFFAATIILVLRGGDNVGQHLGLLSNYFPLYDVTVFGAFVGLVYGFVIGYAVGRLICWVYNAASGK